MTPVLGYAGLVQRRAQFKATYSTSITFHYSPYSGYKFLELGNMGQKLSHPYDDPMDQVSHADTMYHHGVHAENFVCPLTSYVIQDNQARSDLQGDGGIPTTRDPTTQDKIEETMKSVGVKITTDSRGPTVVGTNVSSAFPERTKGQSAPLVTKGMLKHYGLSVDEIRNIEKDLQDTDSDFVLMDDTELSQEGLIVHKTPTTDPNDSDSTIKAPALPLTATIDLTEPKVTMYNSSFVRPGAAWNILGFQPPVMTRGTSRYVPWPKGVKVSGNLCQIADVAKIAELNRIHNRYLQPLNKVLEKVIENKIPSTQLKDVTINWEAPEGQPPNYNFPKVQPGPSSQVPSTSGVEARYLQRNADDLQDFEDFDYKGPKRARRL